LRGRRVDVRDGSQSLVGLVAGPVAAAEAHLTEQGLAAEQKADAWMHEHGAPAALDVDAVVGEGPLAPELVRRADEEAYITPGP
jgi:GABA permease